MVVHGVDTKKRTRWDSEREPTSDKGNESACIYVFQSFRLCSVFFCHSFFRVRLTYRSTSPYVPRSIPVESNLEQFGGRKPKQKHLHQLDARTNPGIHQHLGEWGVGVAVNTSRLHRRRPGFDTRG
jgi:hypothetical protein